MLFLIMPRPAICALKTTWLRLQEDKRTLSTWNCLNTFTYRQLGSPGKDVHTLRSLIDGEIAVTRVLGWHHPWTTLSMWCSTRARKQPLHVALVLPIQISKGLFLCDHIILLNFPMRLEVKEGYLAWHTAFSLTIFIVVLEASWRCNGGSLLCIEKS